MICCTKFFEFDERPAHLLLAACDLSPTFKLLIDPAIHEHRPSIIMAPPPGFADNFTRNINAAHTYPNVHNFHDVEEGNCVFAPFHHTQLDKPMPPPAELRIATPQPGSPTRAIGTSGILYCVGLYVEIPGHGYCCWHIMGAPMGHEADVVDDSSSNDFRRVKRAFHARLVRMFGPCEPETKKSLIVVAYLPTMGTRALIEAILEWSGDIPANASEPKRIGLIQDKVKLGTGFVVTDPGHGRDNDVVVFPPRDERISDKFLYERLHARRGMLFYQRETEWLGWYGMKIQQNGGNWKLKLTPNVTRSLNFFEDSPLQRVVREIWVGNSPWTSRPSLRPSPSQG